MSCDETSGWDDDIQEYDLKNIEEYDLPGNFSMNNSLSRRRKITREETSGWEDEVQEYGKSVSLLPNVPGHNNSVKISSSDLQGFLPLLDDPIVHSGEPSFSCTKTSNNASKSDPSMMVISAPVSQALKVPDKEIGAVCRIKATTPILHVTMQDINVDSEITRPRKFEEPDHRIKRIQCPKIKREVSGCRSRDGEDFKIYIKDCLIDLPEKKDEDPLVWRKSCKDMKSPPAGKASSTWKLLQMPSPSTLAKATTTATTINWDDHLPEIIPNNIVDELKPGSLSKILEKDTENKEDFLSITERTNRSWSLFEPSHFTCEETASKIKWRKSTTLTNFAKSKTKGKKLRDFEFIRMEQSIMQVKGSVNAMKFNLDGRFLATGGEDAILRVWTVVGNSTDRDRLKRSDESDLAPPKGSIINPIPYREFSGHKMDIIDLDWSLKHHILTSSYDTTVRLWHLSSEKYIKVFKHFDYVTSVRFHPTESEYYVSASCDTKIRLWNINTGKPVVWEQLAAEVTAVSFSPNGKFVVAGLSDGQCIFFLLDIGRSQLRWHENVHCRNGKRAGTKVTAVEYLGSDDRENNQGCDQCLVTTNDSRIRLFTLENRQINLRTKYKGHKNTKYQIAATLSHDGKFIISGSDDGAIYIWNKKLESRAKTGHSKTDICEVIKVPGKKRGPTIVAVFAPTRTVRYLERQRIRDTSGYFSGMPKIDQIIVSADIEGIIRIFVNYETKPPAHHHSA